MHSTKHLTATHKLKYTIKHAVYSILKSKSTALYCHHLGFVHSLPFHQLSSDWVNKGNNLMVEPGVLLIFRSYQDGCQLVTVHKTHSNFIVLPHQEIRPLAPWSNIPVSRINPDSKITSPCPILSMPSARLGSNKYQFYKSLVWHHREPNSKLLISRMRGPPSTESATVPGCQYQDDWAEWGIGSWCQWHGVPVEQHYHVTMGAHYHKPVQQTDTFISS